MYIKSIVIILFINICQLQAQERFTLPNTKTVVATPAYTFICEKYALTGEVVIQIGKTEQGGVLKITIDTSTPNTLISGGVYVDLINGDVIACVDKNLRNVENGKTSSFYSFTAQEFSKLKKSNIRAVRLKIDSQGNTFTNQTNFLTAVNKKEYFTTKFQNTDNLFATAKDISNL